MYGMLFWLSTTTSFSLIVPVARVSHELLKFCLLLCLVFIHVFAFSFVLCPGFFDRSMYYSVFLMLGSIYYMAPGYVLLCYVSAHGGNSIDYELNV